MALQYKSTWHGNMCKRGGAACNIVTVRLCCSSRLGKFEMVSAPWVTNSGLEKKRACFKAESKSAPRTRTVAEG